MTKRFAGLGAAVALITLAAGASYGQDCTGPLGAPSPDGDGPCWTTLFGVTSAYLAWTKTEQVSAHSSVITSAEDARAGVITIVEFTYWRTPEDGYIRCRDVYREDGSRLRGTASICQMPSTAQ